MGWWPFGRRETEDTSVDTLLAQADLASPTGTASVSPAGGPTGAFRLTVEDIFSITGRGTVVTGRVESGTLTVGEEVRVVRDEVVVATTEVTGIEAFRKTLTQAGAGDNVGILVARLSRDDVRRGDVLER